MLIKWVQPQHLNSQAIEQLKSLSKTQLEAGVFLDNFLKEECLARLQRTLSDEATFKANYRVYSNKYDVTEEEYYSHAEKELFFHFNELCGVKPEYAMSINWLTYLRFHHDYHLGMSALLGDIIGTQLSARGQSTFIIRQHNSLRRHNDYRPGRKICTILYLSNEWNPQYGGDLVMSYKEKESGEIRVVNRIAHHPNRLVIFSVNRNTFHHVTSLTELGKDKCRCSYVRWFNDAARDRL